MLCQSDLTVKSTVGHRAPGRVESNVRPPAFDARFSCRKRTVLIRHHLKSQLFRLVENPCAVIGLLT